MESGNSKPRKKRVEREDVSGQMLTASLIGEIDRLEAIGKQAGYTAEMLKGLIEQAGQTKIMVDIEPLKEYSDKLTRELKKQVQYVVQPQIVLKVIIGLFVVSLVATWAAGYYIQDRQVWKERADHWYQQHENLQTEMQVEKTAKKKK